MTKVKVIYYRTRTLANGSTQYYTEQESDEPKALVTWDRVSIKELRQDEGVWVEMILRPDLSWMCVE